MRCSAIKSRRQGRMPYNGRSSSVYYTKCAGAVPLGNILRLGRSGREPTVRGEEAGGKTLHFQEGLFGLCGLSC
jgi:hypothetical protein